MHHTVSLFAEIIELAFETGSIELELAEVLGVEGDVVEFRVGMSVALEGLYMEDNVFEEEFA